MPYQDRRSIVRPIARSLVAAAASIVCLAAPAAAQPVEFTDAPVVPGWVLTPTVSFGATWDDNVVLAAEGNPTPDDTVLTARPGLDLTFTARHTTISAGYHGGLIRYRELGEYDNYTQGGRFELRHQPGSRVSLYLRDGFTVTPTTDAIEVAGIPFSRTGTRQNTLSTGASIDVTRRFVLNGGYDFQWLEFDRRPEEDPLGLLLQGGQAHGVTLGGRHHLQSRLRIGADYSIRRGTLGQTAEAFTVQNAQAVVEWQPTRTLSVEGAAGVSYLALPAPGGNRTGPALRAAVRKRTEHALFSLSAARSFAPAFGFGGSLQNQEVAAAVRVPFARNRAYVDGSTAWRRSEPVLTRELQLDAIWLQTTVGYAFRRWLRVEFFYTGAFQDTPVFEGGQVERNRFGVQVVTSRPMRFR